MSSNDKVAATFHPNVDHVRSDLMRRRELAKLKKAELINIIRSLEAGLSCAKNATSPKRRTHAAQYAPSCAPPATGKKTDPQGE